MSRRAAGAGIAPRGGGVWTEHWGWQPTARLVAGLPAWSWRSAPRGLLTRRQIREAGLAPGGTDPVGLVVCRRGRRWAYLWRQEDLVAKRVSSPAQLVALDRALAARRWCPSCRRDVGYCIPKSLGECVDCAEPVVPR